MIELVQHLRFVERQITSVVPTVDVALAAATFLLQLSACPEVVGVVGHVKERSERNPPRIGFRLVPVRLTPEHRDAAIDGLGQLGVACALKDRAGARIGIEKIDVFGRKRKLLFRLTRYPQL